jgi:hypothetical protein
LKEELYTVSEKGLPDLINYVNTDEFSFHDVYMPNFARPEILYEYKYANCVVRIFIGFYENDIELLDLKDLYNYSYKSKIFSNKLLEFEFIYVVELIKEPESYLIFDSDAVSE